MPKDFIFRSIPDSLHQDWKNFSDRRGFTMRSYLLVALKRHIDRDKLQAGKSEDDRENKES